jgi:hypothetical protein
LEAEAPEIPPTTLLMQSFCGPSWQLQLICIRPGMTADMSRLLKESALCQKRTHLNHREAHDFLPLARSLD